MTIPLHTVTFHTWLLALLLTVVGLVLAMYSLRAELREHDAKATSFIVTIYASLAIFGSILTALTVNVLVTDQAVGDGLTISQKEGLTIETNYVTKADVARIYHEHFHLTPDTENGVTDLTKVSDDKGRSFSGCTPKFDVSGRSVSIRSITCDSQNIELTPGDTH